MGRGPSPARQAAYGPQFPGKVVWSWAEALHYCYYGGAHGNCFRCRRRRCLAFAKSKKSLVVRLCVRICVYRFARFSTKRGCSSMSGTGEDPRETRSATETDYLEQICSHSGAAADGRR